MTAKGDNDGSTTPKSYLIMKASAEEALSLAAEWWENKEVPKYIHVRMIERTDLEAFVELYNKCFLASPDPFRLLTLEEAQRLDFEGVFVAEMWDTYSGFIACFVEKDENSIYGEITGIGVLPSRRRRGVATALIRCASEYFIDAGVEDVYCEVFEDNAPSQMLIASYGFKEVGRRDIPGITAPSEIESISPRGGKIMRRLGLRPMGS
ncbi:MAG: GNAT family N-acetyltransferase [Candidatus Thorarchaeota archaeon]|nr:GNAT family N-acetyltransferase [Candidatus Thorarchaeota archaeon]